MSIKRKKIVTLRLNEDEYQDLVYMSQQSGLSLSSYIRAIIKKSIPTLGNPIFCNHKEFEFLKLDTYRERRLKSANDVYYQLKKLNEEKYSKFPYILVTDDENAQREIIPNFLDEFLKKDIYVKTAEDGYEALRNIEKKQPILLFLDLIMPKLDGYEVMKQISKSDNVFPIIVLSAYAHEKNEIAIRGEIEPNRLELLRKPYSFDELQDIVEKTISKYTDL